MKFHNDFSTLLLFFFLFITATTAQNDPNCGTNGPVQSKIVGGVEATPYEWSWSASLGYLIMSSSGKEEYFNSCTGSIIHSQFVLTAAHCAGIMTSNKPSVNMAVHNVSLNAPEPRKVSMPIEAFIQHPNYTKLWNNVTIYDVALVKLAEPLDIAGNPDLGTICVPPQDNSDYYGALATAIGWGWTIDGDPNSWSLVLRKVTVPVANMNWCKEVYHLEESVDTMMCTYAIGKSPCKGDSGGPLMLQNEDDGRWWVVGATSGAVGCGRQGFPNMYAHVAYMSDWIWEAVKANGG